MPNFKYVVKDQRGKTIAGILEAASEDSAVGILKDKKFIVISVQRKKESAFFSRTPPLSSVKVKLDDLAIFSRQLSTMVNAGLPLVQSLDILSEQSERRLFKAVIEKVKEGVEGGSSLSEALSKYPKIFSRLFVNVISAGEASGMLDEILARMSTYLEETSKLQKKIKSTLVYPTAIAVTAVVITTFILVKVVPAFEDIYLGFGVELPIPTQFLLFFSRAIREWLLVSFLSLIVIIVGIYAFTRTNKGKVFIDRLLLKLPIAGKLIKKVCVSRFSRTLATLTRSGVPILTSLEIVAKTSGNKVIENAVIEASESVRSGETIARPLSKSGIFPMLVIRMIAVGEQTGALEEMLNKVADFYDTEVSSAVEGLTSLIEPIVIVSLGLIIGGIVIALYLPVFNIAGLIA